MRGSAPPGPPFPLRLALHFDTFGCYPGRTMRRVISNLLAALWVVLTITIACSGVASASADDSRLLPYGPAAHLWLCPKAGNRTPTKAIGDSLAAKARIRCSDRGVDAFEPARSIDSATPRAPLVHDFLHRRLGPRDGDDPPLLA